jgi:hypothetical protein
MSLRDTERQRRVREHRSSLGLCYVCGKEPALPGLRKGVYCQGLGKTRCRNYYLVNREKVLQNCRRYRKDNPRCTIKTAEASRSHWTRVKLKVFNHYGTECACCGQDVFEFMTIDHIHGGGCKHRKQLGKSGIAFYLHLIKEGFPPGYQTLCWDCQHGRRIGFCPDKHRQLIKDKDLGKSA